MDGDSDNGQVMKELRRAIHREVGALRRERAVESIDENGMAARKTSDMFMMLERQLQRKK